MRQIGATHQWLRNNVLGLVAIFIALSGTAWAAQAVTDGGKAKFAAKKKKAKPGPPGPVGPAGPQGPQGSQGLQGPAGPNNVTVVRTTLALDADADGVGDYAYCPAGQRATGGGVGFNGAQAFNGTRTIESSGPINETLGSFANITTGEAPTGWFASVAKTAGAAATAYVYAICQ